jgi:hypothetical protein
MAKHKVFIGAMYSESYQEGDTCVMLVFPKGSNVRTHEVIRPILLQADNIRDLHAKIDGEINTYLSNVYGFVPKTYSSAPAAPAGPVAMVEVDSLTIADPGPAVSDPSKSQLLLDLGSII